MRKTFPDFYGKPKDLQEVWGNAYFSFDTSFLLELFDLSTEARNECIKLVKTIAKSKRWLTFQAAREYHSGVAGVIQKHAGRTSEIDKIVDGMKVPSFSGLTKKASLFSADPNKVFDVHAGILKEPIEKWQQSIAKTITELKEQYEKDCEATRNQIADLFDGTVGAPYKDKWLAEKHNYAAVRADNRIPPGYADKETKGVNAYGDILMWFELLEETERRQAPLIFVTKDVKGDWFTKEKKEEGKILHPRPELATEMMLRTGQRFVLYEFYEFIKTAPDYLGKGAAISEGSLSEIAAAKFVSPAWKQRWQDLKHESEQLKDEALKLEARIRSFETGATPANEANKAAYLFRIQRRNALYNRIDEITDEQLDIFNREVDID